MPAFRAAFSGRPRLRFVAPDIELDSLDAVKDLLLESRTARVTILPLRSVQAEVAAGALSVAEFDEPDMRRTIALATRVQPHNPQATALLRAWVIERSRKLKNAPNGPKTAFNPSRGPHP